MTRAAILDSALGLASQMGLEGLSIGALADAFGCSVNELPLSLVLSWYEQKAVTVLLALLHLGVKNIRLGPTLPAFLSPNVAKVIVEAFNLKPIDSVEADVAAMMAGA